MPSRLLREGILDSEGVNQLSWQGEVFYRRLMSVVDDFGRFDGRPSILRSRLYALRVESVREADISRWIAECEKAGLIALYAVDGKPYILFRKLGSPRAKESKYPLPPDSLDTVAPASTHPFTDVNDRKQTEASVPYSGSGSGSGTKKDPPTPPAGGTAGELFDKGAAPKPPKPGKRPPDQTPFFAEFWAAYPKKVAKEAAARAFAKHAPSRDTLDVMLAAIEWQAKTDQWRKADGEFIPNPATWLNNRRWEDQRPDVPRYDPAAENARMERERLARLEHEKGVY